MKDIFVCKKFDDFHLSFTIANRFYNKYYTNAYNNGIVVPGVIDVNNASAFKEYIICHY